MKKFTQADFNALKRNGTVGIRCESGDWTDVDFMGAKGIEFDDGCILGEFCDVGDYSVFGVGCVIGECSDISDACAFGRECKIMGCSRLGADCSIGRACEFGSNCIFADNCGFASGCVFGANCKFGEHCYLLNCAMDEDCRLSNHMELCGHCVLEKGKIRNPAIFVIQGIGSENRDAYFYCDGLSGDIFVRAGCWFSRDDAFVERVKRVHGGTKYEAEYLAAVDFVRVCFAEHIAAAPGIENELITAELACPGNGEGRCDCIENFNFEECTEF